MSIKINGSNRESTVYLNDTMGHGAAYFINHADEYEIMRTNNFELVITGLDNLMLATTNGPVPLPIADPQNVLRLAVSQSSLPHFTQSPITVSRGNDTLKYAGVPLWGDGTFTFREFIGNNTRMILQAWRDATYNLKTGKVGVQEDYKKTAYIMEYTPDWQLVQTTKLNGLWISDVSPSNKSYDDNSASTCSVTFLYDSAEIDYDGII